MRKTRVAYFLVSSILVFSTFVNPLFSSSKKDPGFKDLGNKSVQECYSFVTKAYLEKRWEDLLYSASFLVSKHLGSAFADESLFYLGVAHFHLGDFNLANQNLTGYLKQNFTPKFFEESFHYKFLIAEGYKKGAKKHVLGWKIMPKWVPAKEDAIKIYEEIINALPQHELSVKSLFNKAQILFEQEDYEQSIETYKQAIQYFSKHPLAIESHLEIQKVYLKQSSPKHQNPDLIALAEVNLKKFKASFPGEEKVAIAENIYEDMRNVYAKGLFEIGQFYERTKKYGAAKIYYSKIISTYPNSKTAKLSMQCFEKLEKRKK